MSTDIVTTQIEAPGRPANATPRLNNRLIESVDVKLETYLGATSMTIAALNDLRVGSAIALDAALNEVVELRLNGVCIAHGELVAVGDKFGVRVTAIAT
jgi:flagellar motor switch protein FliN/FliY